MRRHLTSAITFLLLASATPARAEAILIDPSVPTFEPGDVKLVGTTNINRNLSLAALEDLFDVDLGSLLYKSEVDGRESGAAAMSYTTTYLNSATDPSGALITWNGPTLFSCPECYLLVKGGRQTPSQYLFDLGAWNGQDSITLAGFWPRQGAISHIALYGPGVTSVPEPASLTLVLLGVGAMGVARRRRRQS